VALGEFLIASEAIGTDGATLAYGGSGGPVAAAPRLVETLERAVTAADIRWRKGRFASFDGFYRDMFSLEAETRQRVAEVRRDLLRENVLVTDMESSAIFTAAKALGVEAGSLCVATVDSETQAKIDGEEMDLLERRLFLTALDTLAGLQPAEPA